MRICVFGAGAIGGHVAFRLARGGADVSVVARGPHLAAIRTDGLTVQAPDAAGTVRIAATDDPATLGPQDAVIVTVKAPSLPDVAREIGPLLGPDTAVAFVMNGVPWWYFHGVGGAQEGRRLPRLDPGDALWTAVGPHRALGGVVYSACEAIAPGTVRVTNANSRVILGEPDGRPGSRAEAIAAALRAGGMGGEVAGSIRRAVWEKWLGNITGGPLCILARQPMRTILTDPALQQTARRMMEEAAAIAAGLGHAIAVDIDARMARSAGMDHRPSILQDLERGRPMEVDAQFTVPLELAAEAGVPTPTLDVMVALVRQVARGAGLYAA